MLRKRKQKYFETPDFGIKDWAFAVHGELYWVTSVIHMDVVKGPFSYEKEEVSETATILSCHTPNSAEAGG